MNTFASPCRRSCVYPFIRNAAGAKARGVGRSQIVEPKIGNAYASTPAQPTQSFAAPTSPCSAAGRVRSHAPGINVVECVGRIDEAARLAADRAAQPGAGPLLPPVGQLREARDRNRHRDRSDTAEWCRRTDRKGTLIRHLGRVALPVGALPVAMIEPALRTLLVAAVGGAVLPEPGFGATSRAAIALPAITVRADPEHHLAFRAAANPEPANHFPTNRHRSPPAGFDNGNGSCQGGNSLDGILRMKVAKPEPRCLQRRGSPPPSQVAAHSSGECLDSEGLERAGAGR